MYCVWCRRRLLATDCICPGCGAPVIEPYRQEPTPVPADAPVGSNPGHEVTWRETVEPSVVVQPDGPGIFVRAIWFIFIGWWLSYWAIVAGYLLMMTVIGLPLAFWLFNRVPTLLTLRPRTMVYETYQRLDGAVVYRSTLPQISFLARSLWFLLIGWWLTAIWLVFAYLLLLPVITIPLSILMLDRVGGVMTLHRH